MSRVLEFKEFNIRNYNDAQRMIEEMVEYRGIMLEKYSDKKCVAKLYRENENYILEIEENEDKGEEQKDDKKSEEEER